MNTAPTPHGLDAIAGAARAAGRGGPPPVELWNPPFCGDLDMRIAADGTWFYLETPIGRPALVKLFASVLKREGDRYFLVTPVEKCGIAVDDAPFLAVELHVRAAAIAARLLHFRTNVDDWVACGSGHELRFEPEPATGGLKPYLHVRRGLWAKVTRALFYDLVELGEEREIDSRRMFGVASDGDFFAMAPADRIEGLRLMDVAPPSGGDRAGPDFFARARARLSLEVPAGVARPRAPQAGVAISISNRFWERAGVQATRPAAVLIPVVDRPEPQVLLTQRTELPSHPGQIAFPGGKIDPYDESPAAAAMREAARGDRTCTAADRTDRLSRSLSHLLRLPHPADAGACARGLSA